MVNDLIDSEIERTREELDTIKKKEMIISLLRLISFFIGTICIAVYFMGNKNVFCLFCGLMMFASFFLLIWIHDQKIIKKKTLEAKVSVYERYAARNILDWDKLLPDAVFDPEYKKTHMELWDLDVFGENSLYRYLCTAHSDLGREKLKNLLMEHDEQMEDWQKRQNLVWELGNDFSICTEIESIMETLEVKKNSFVQIDEILTWLTMSENRKNKRIIYAGFFPVIIFWVMVIFYFITAQKGFLLGSIFLFLVNVMYQMVFVEANCKADCNEKILYGVCDLADKFVAMIEKKQGGINALELFAQEIRSLSLQKSIRAWKIVKELKTLKHHALFHFLLCGISGLSGFLIILEEKWKRKYGDNVSVAMTKMAELECLVSLALPAHFHNVTKAVVYQKNTQLWKDFQAENLIHPLILKEKAVGNGIGLQHGITVITGSNMSGKTTFLRTIGINMLLAYAGGVVCADRLVIPKVKIYTSMRVMDNVNDGISSFYGEILRIRSMVEAQTPSLFLIDEIFKGTNSADRITGASKVLTKLSEKKESRIMVSTHDFNLCDLKDAYGEKTDNYHFEEYYQGDKICFDYKIKQGRCQTTNAMQLLKLSGVLVEW